MENRPNGLSGIVSIPLISFDSIIDEDIACIKYAILDIGENPSFDLSFLKDKTMIDIISDLYYRKYENPLYYIKSENANTELLDKVYIELLSEREADVLQHAVATDWYNVIVDFKKSSDIFPTILYYTDAQKDLLKSLDKLHGIDLVSIEEAKKNPNQWIQYYFKYLYELEPFKKLKEKSFYFSSSALNLVEDNTDIALSRDDVIDIVKYNNKISLYDIYRTNVIGSI